MRTLPVGTPSLGELLAAPSIPGTQHVQLKQGVNSSEGTVVLRKIDMQEYGFMSPPTVCMSNPKASVLIFGARLECLGCDCVPEAVPCLVQRTLTF